MQTTQQQSISKQNTQSNKSKQKNSYMQKTWFLVLVFIVATALLGLLSSLMGGNMKAYLSLSRPPFSALPICYFVTRLIMYMALGVSIYMVYRERNRKKFNRNIDLICFYTQLALAFFFPLFFFRLGLHIFATVWLGVSIVLAIITLVRFWANNTVAGIIYSVYTLWLMYLFYVALGICLLK